MSEIINQEPEKKLDISKLTTEQLKKKLKGLKDDVAACDKQVEDLRQEYNIKIGEVTVAKAEKQAEISAIEAEIKLLFE